VQPAVRFEWTKVIALELASLAFLGVLTLIAGKEVTLSGEGRGGGILGWGLLEILGVVMGPTWQAILLVVATLALSAYGLSLSLERLEAWMRGVSRKEEQAGLSQIAGSSETAGNNARRRPAEGREATLPEPSPPHPSTSQPVSKESRKALKAKAPHSTKPLRQKRDRRLPPLEVFEGGEVESPGIREVNQTAGIIEKTLADFGIPAKVVGYRTGPTVTQFAVEPGFLEKPAQDGALRRSKVRVSQISALADDLALALAAPTLRIEAPVPGQSYVGVEVPHRRSSLVRLRPVMESPAFQKKHSPLMLALGMDVAGQSVAADLAVMPHLLIAGTTGSGKSVCITAMTACLVANNTPEDLRLVLIDPKMVELVRFNGLPHLLGEVETDLRRILAVLRWLTREMDRRYRLLESLGARHLEDYNRKVGIRTEGERLPRIVVLLDELADLMMMAPDETERTVIRLAQMSRATGIHLVLATQRPSTDVVTGLIKANFPARISFAVASSVDSRVILDSPGAESLLGRGDMLFLSPESGSARRLQGCFVSDSEIRRLIEFWQSQREEPTRESERAGPPQERPAEASAAEPPWENMIQEGGEQEGEDEAEFEQAVALVRQYGRASASLLQRKMRIGYPRAARIMDELYERGIVGREQSGGKTREVLVSREPREGGEEKGEG
jgi:S-DNA-T family DNA segregation ATPase FtsK/SpoIIIE